MTNSGPEEILSRLRENSKDDENVSKFLVEIFIEEFVGIMQWKKSYHKILKKYSK